MISTNRDFLERHIKRSKNNGVSLEKYLIDNEVDFIVRYYLSSDIGGELLGQEEDLLFDKFNKTLGLLQNMAKSAPFAIIKMLPGYEVVRSDIDILMPGPEDTDCAAAILQKNGFKKLSYSKFYRWQPANERYKQIWFHEKGDFLNIHLHRHIAWGSVVYLEAAAVFSSLEEKEICGKNFLVPDKETSLTINVLHIVFENFKFTLRDFLETREIVRGGNINLDNLVQKNSGWRQGAARLFKDVYSFLENKNDFIHFPFYLQRNSLMQLRIGKFFKNKSYFEAESYFFDFLKLYIIWPLRNKGIIR